MAFIKLMDKLTFIGWFPFRRDKMIIVLLSMFCVYSYIIKPMSDRNGTVDLRTIDVEVLKEPYISSDTLEYRWSGVITRSCPLTFERFYVYASGARSVVSIQDEGRPALPEEALGFASFTIKTKIPVQLQEGDWEYHVISRPECNFWQWLYPPKIEYPIVKFTVTNR